MVPHLNENKTQSLQCLTRFCIIWSSTDWLHLLLLMYSYHTGLLVLLHLLQMCYCFGIFVNALHLTEIFFFSCLLDNSLTSFKADEISTSQWGLCWPLHFNTTAPTTSHILRLQILFICQFFFFASISTYMLKLIHLFTTYCPLHPSYNE